jgi:hypothetical protein
MEMFDAYTTVHRMYHIALTLIALESATLFLPEVHPLRISVRSVLTRIPPSYFICKRVADQSA